ncbi:DNA methylase [Pseudomonas viridiflava]|uniref:DNA methylase n=1 Tax=Pseudomonas viridiflava TaxID=33069 RepID=UPI000F055D82|nr:DNA methylase [Pseudomonas viridiflava]
MGKVVTARDLAVDLKQGDDVALFKWFIASFLMGKRIQADIAAQAYRVIVDQHGCDTPRKLASKTHRQLVTMLGEARYVRYDESTAMRLAALATKLTEEYAGKIAQVAARSDGRADFEKRLGEFDGVGPKTIEIFMREAGEVLY